MVQWTGDKDAILLMGIFEVMDIKVSMHLCGELAKKIGEGCTAKAVSHRIHNLKMRGKPGAAGTPGSTPKKGTAKTARSAARGKKNKGGGGEGDLVDDEEEEGLSPSRGRKRGRGGKVESDDGECKKKVKREIVDEDEEEFKMLFGRKNRVGLKGVGGDESDEEI